MHKSPRTLRKIDRGRVCVRLARRYDSPMPPDPTAYLTAALDAAGTDVDLNVAVHAGLARLQREAHDELLTALVLEDDRAARLELVQASTTWHRDALAAHDRLIAHLAGLNGGAGQP